MQNRPPILPGVAIASVCLCAAALLTWSAQPTSGTGPVSPVLVSGFPHATIEALFAARGVVQLGGMEYRLSDGIFKSLHGARAWVAVPARSPKGVADATHPMLVERDGQVLYGTLRAIASQHANLQQSQDRKPEVQI